MGIVIWRASQRVDVDGVVKAGAIARGRMRLVEYFGAEDVVDSWGEEGRFGEGAAEGALDSEEQGEEGGDDGSAGVGLVRLESGLRLLI